jgi:4-amino-4-deoxychorismate lyase
MSEPDVAALVNGAPLATVGVSDRGLHYGDGVFETMICSGGRARWFDRHWQRLMLGCQRLHMTGPDLATIRAEIEALAGGAEPCIVKLIVTRGPALARGYQPTGKEQPTRILLRYPWSAPPTSLRLGFSAVSLGENAALAGIKHLNRLEQVLARQQAGGSLDEVVMRSQSGLPTCGSMSNLFVCEAGMLLTPDLNRCGVAGVMRSLVIDAAHALGLELQIAALDAARLRAAPGLFMTNVRWGLKTVREFEGRTMPEDRRVIALQEWINAQAV